MVDIWKKLTSEKAGDIIDVNELDESSVELFKPEMRPEEYIAALSSAGKWSEAVTILARALPKREALWWACVCAKKMEVLSTNKQEASAFKIAEKWAFKPTEDNRRQAFLQAQTSKSPSVGTLSCLAAAFSGGKLALNEEQSVDLDASAFPKMVGAVILLAASEKGADQINKMLEKFLLMGKDIACGGRGQVKA